MENTTMKAIASALLILGLAGTARAENLQGTWTGELVPVSSTCDQSVNPAESFYERLSVSSRSLRRLPPHGGTFRGGKSPGGMFFGARYEDDSATYYGLSGNGDGRTAIVTLVE